MRRATKAALQSALILPGAGHIGLNRYVRGSVLMVSALLAILVIVKNVYQSAVSTVVAMSDGEVPDADLISEIVMHSANTPTGPSGKIALIVLLASWLIGIIDAYRLGAADASADEG